MLTTVFKLKKTNIDTYDSAILQLNSDMLAILAMSGRASMGRLKVINTGPNSPRGAMSKTGRDRWVGGKKTGDTREGGICLLELQMSERVTLTFLTP